MAKKTFYVTTPIYYPSGKPHIGHAYSTIYADVLCRYKALAGYDAFMQTGMDEHGQKIEEAAKKIGKDTKHFVDEIGKVFLDLWKQLDINYSSFVKTSDPKHENVVQQVFQEFQDKGYIYMGKWTGLYCVSCEEGYTEDRSHKDKDGHLVCQFGHQLTQRQEDSFFFKMSEFEAWVKQWYDEHPTFIVPHSRVNELTNSFLSEGLQDLSVSRNNFKWGISVLSNPDHVIYVWIDALLNYLTGLGYRTKDDTLYKKYWDNKNAEIVHVMSKEITRFHCIYWPIMLKCLNVKQPTRVISHGWIVTKEGKMSKSLGNVIDPFEYVKDYGSDALRYFLMKEMSVERDGIFAKDLFIECFNADLANTYGNLVSRLIGMVQKYNNGLIQKGASTHSDLSIELQNRGNALIDATKYCISECKIDELIKNVVDYGKLANKYVEDTKPWELAKANKTEEIKSFIFHLANAVRIITSILQPILTKGTKQMVEQLKLTSEQVDFDKLNNWDLLDNHKVGTPTPIYMRLEVKK